VTIEVLPDDVFLDIFELYMRQARRRSSEGIEAWHTLVHVCRHWRNIVFGSPLRLNLQLLCTSSTPVRERLDVWPALPICVRDEGAISDLDNIIAVLDHNDRICEISLCEVSNRLLERVYVALMKEPFPALTQLDLQADYDATTPAIPPEPFRGGIVPRLQEFSLEGIPIPDLPKLLLSATHLVDLALCNIPNPGYISPEAVVACLSALTSLEGFHLDFQLPQSYPDREILRPRQPTRSVLPSLATFAFGGISKYLEDFVARIDAPRLSHVRITFVNHTVFDTSQLVHFINYTPCLKAPDEVHVAIHDFSVFVTLSSPTHGFEEPDVKIVCIGSDGRLSSLAAQVCSSFSPSLSMVESLYIYQHQYSEPKWQDDGIENTTWLELFRPFTILKNLYLCKLFAPRVAPSLQVLVEENMRQVLPVLQDVALEGLQPSGPVQEGIAQFVAARRLAGHPIAVSDWVRT
jgi:hypothetical protein